MIRGASRFLLAALLLGATGASAQHRRGDSENDRGGSGFERGGGRAAPASFGLASGDPSAIVAAEFAFAQLARDQGQWTAFRKTADKDAVMFVPQAVNAQSWLKKRKDPATALSWSAHAIYVACDGSYAASTGSWQRPDGSTGPFVTLWRQQPDGSYKWLLDWSGAQTTRQDAGAAHHDGIDGVIDGKVADCAAPGRSAAAGPAGPDSISDLPPRQDRERGRRGKKAKREIVRIPDPPPANGQGQSDDGTLRWTWTSAPGKPRTLTISMHLNGQMTKVIADSVVAAMP